MINGKFDEVIPDSTAATAALKAMIESFGGKTNARYSKNTSKYTGRALEVCKARISPTYSRCARSDYLLAGRDAESSKIKDAGKRSVEVLSLHRLGMLLRGRITFERPKQLDPLTKDDFNSANYRPAGTAIEMTETDSASATVPAVVSMSSNRLD